MIYYIPHQELSDLINRYLKTNENNPPVDINDMLSQANNGEWVSEFTLMSSVGPIPNYLLRIYTRWFYEGIYNEYDIMDLIYLFLQMLCNKEILCGGEFRITK